MNPKELIFITNDDGYNAKGLKVLHYVAKLLSSNVWSFAPLRNNSGKSHSITINKKKKIYDLGSKNFKVDGTPVDCVIAGNKYLATKKLRPSLLLSGVNYGQNLGLDLLYSGTVAAAREGSIQGIQSFSISLEKNDRPSNWKTIKFFLPRILKAISIQNFKTQIFFNINFPNQKIELIKGCKVVNTGFRKPGELMQFFKNDKKSFYFNIPSERKIHFSATSNEDEYEIKEKFITITYHSNSNSIEKNFYKKLSNSIGKIIE